jgi:hypothetical protein
VQLEVGEDAGCDFSEGGGWRGGHVRDYRLQRGRCAAMRVLNESQSHQQSRLH